MLGAIAGDIIGSVYERNKAWQQVRTPAFEPLFARRARFTDDTVLTVAVADSILRAADLMEVLKEYARMYPGAGYGSSFARWAESEDR
jgi:ADP-ribosylglycohydrolase